MMMNSPLPQSSRNWNFVDRRNLRAPFFTLLEVDPIDVIDGVMLEEGYLSEDAASVGRMREHCPYCSGIALQLILRYRHVKRTHLFCECCTRCFDALYPDGTSALAIGTMSLA